MSGDNEPGASIHQGHDPRVTNGAKWISNLLQALMVIALAGVVKNLIDVNLTLRDFASSNTEMRNAVLDLKAADRDLRSDLKELNGRVYVLEGRDPRDQRDQRDQRESRR